jgi:hypothetical protein
MATRLVLTLRQIVDNTIHMSLRTIHGPSISPDPSFVVRSFLGNIAAPLRDVDEDDKLEEDVVLTQIVEVQS